MSDPRIVTNNMPRPVIDAYELSAEERADLDYLDWPAIDAGEESATFFRYRGQLYELGEFTRCDNLPEFSPLRAWHGHLANSFFSAIVVRFPADDDYETVVVGTYVTGEEA